MELWQALILAVVEGLTEYLPISSTGHLILTSWLMGINQDPFVKDFTVIVQFGAILAVLLLYWRRFVMNFRLYPRVLVAFLPAAVVGLLVKDYIDALLGSVWTVAVALILGGVALIITDRLLRNRTTRTRSLEDLPVTSAFKIGLFQLLAFVPGVSRAAASIWGGLYQGLDLRLATEFSFFLAVPTLTGASFLKLRKVWPSLTPGQIEHVLWGNALSFVVGALAIHFFVRWVANSGLKFFGYYRIALGLVVVGVLVIGNSDSLNWSLILQVIFPIA